MKPRNYPRASLNKNHRFACAYVYGMFAGAGFDRSAPTEKSLLTLAGDLSLFPVISFVRNLRAVVTRVRSASVRVDDTVVGEIAEGLLVLVGVARDDGDDDAIALAKKIATLRIFPDASGAMNRSIIDCGGAALVVSQFTLLGDARGGRRPSFSAAAGAALGRSLYERVVREIAACGIPVATGSFGADMAVASVNDGPVTLLLDTRKLF